MALYNYNYNAFILENFLENYIKHHSTRHWCTVSYILINITTEKFKRKMCTYSKLKRKEENIVYNTKRNEYYVSKTY